MTTEGGSCGNWTREEIRNRVDDLSAKQRIYLSKLTREILDGHGEIQREHRDQAKWFLRAYVTGTGILIAALAWAIGTLREMSLLVGNVRTYRVVLLAPFLAGLGVYLLFRGFVRFIGTLELVIAVLSPKRFDNESWPLGLLRNLVWYREAVLPDEFDRSGSRAKETVERVMEADLLVGAIKDGSRKRARTLTDQVCRIGHNEKSINKSMRRLTLVYRITAASLGDAVLGVAAVAVTKFFLLPG